MEEVVGIIEKALEVVDKHSFGFIVALSGVGIVTMALLQLFKDLLPSRRVFQRWWFGRWFEQAAAVQNIKLPTAKKALDELIVLATAGDDKALYELPVEQFTGQINAAVQAVLDQPQKYGSLVQILARHADRNDVKLLLKSRPTKGVALEKYMEARNRVSRQIQRTLDALQIVSSSTWRRLLHWLSVGISAVIIGAALTILGGTAIWKGPTYGYALAAALFGAFLAPVARDIVAAIQKLRARPR